MASFSLLQGTMSQPWLSFLEIVEKNYLSSIGKNELITASFLVLYGKNESKSALFSILCGKINKLQFSSLVYHKKIIERMTPLLVMRKSSWEKN